MRVRPCIRRQAATTAVALLLGAALALTTPLTARAAKQTRWSKLWNKYRDKKNTDRLIFVKYLGGSDCKVLMYRKVPRKNGSFRWKKILACPGYVGRNGIGKAREGDVRTPTGTFRIGEAFGILDDPGTELASAFKVLDKGSAPRGVGAILCLRETLSAIDRNTFIVPIWMISL